MRPWTVALMALFVACVATSVLALRGWAREEPAPPVPRTVADQFTFTNRVLLKAGVTPDLWRPPYNRTTDQIDRLASDLGMAKATWNIDPEDYDRVGEPDKVVASTLRMAVDEGVVLLHDGHSPPEHDDTTLRALPRIIAGLKRKGFCFGRLGIVRNVVTTVRPPDCTKVIALTFDDGPDEIVTPRVLEVLRRHDVRASFFVTGQRTAEHPEIVRAIRRAGHTVGNHSWDHRDLTLVGR